MRAVSRLGNANDSEMDAKKVMAFMELIERPKRARNLRGKLMMPSRQTGRFLKEIDEVKREKKGKTFQYTVEIPEVPKRIEYGDEWVEIEIVEKNGIKYKKITSSQGDERLIVL